MKIRLILLTFVLLINICLAYSQLEKLYDFKAERTLSKPGGLITDGIYLYGMTQRGGKYDNGTIFKIKLDGTGYVLMHEFNSIDGSIPIDELTLSENTLFGVTIYGGLFGYGTIFKINTDGTGFTTIHHCESNLIHLNGTLTLSGTDIYGTTTSKIFKMKTDGSGLTVIKSIINSNGHGNTKYVYLDNNILHGVVKGNSSLHYIYKVNTDASGFTIIHNFLSALYPYSKNNTVRRHVLNGDYLYGIDELNQYAGYSLYKVKKDGSEFKVIKNFPSDFKIIGSLTTDGVYMYSLIDSSGITKTLKINFDGTYYKTMVVTNGVFNINPYYDSESSLLYYQNSLYGMSNLNTNDFAYKLNTDGTGFKNIFWLYSAVNGKYPNNEVGFYNEYLYGKTNSGGASNNGCYYRFNTVDRSYKKITDFTNTPANTITSDLSKVVFVDSVLYGYKSNTNEIVKMHVEGTGYKLIFDTKVIGKQVAEMTYSNNALYFIAHSEIRTSYSIYKINKDETALQLIFDFPLFFNYKNISNFIVSGTEIFFAADASVDTKIYKLNIDATGFKEIATGPKYYTPQLHESNNMLFYLDGSKIMSVNKDGSNQKMIYDNGTQVGYMIIKNNRIFARKIDSDRRFLYLFSIKLDGTGFVKMADFDQNLYSDYRDDKLHLTFGDKYLYGILRLGGEDFIGQIFRCDTNVLNRKNQTITFEAIADKTIGDAPFTLNAVASSGLAVTYISSNTAVATVSGNTITITGAGTTNLTASQAGNTIYNAAPNVVQPLIVNSIAKQNQTITFAALASKTYGDQTFALNATASSGLAVTYTSSNTSVATFSGNYLFIVGAGTTTIKASQAGNAIYNAAVDVAQVLTVKKAEQTITFNILPTKSLGDVPITLNATASSNLSVTYTSSNNAVATVTGNIISIVGAGTTNITAAQTGNANYNSAVSIVQPFIVYSNLNRANQTITFNAIPVKIFGDAPFTLNASASSGLAINYISSNGNIATILDNTLTIVGAGTCNITAVQVGNFDYKPAADVTQILTVTPTIPVVKTISVTNKTSSSAIANGEVTNDGGETGIARGFCLNKTGMPDITDLTVSAEGGKGTFTAAITYLTPNTTYYLRAYATTSAGTSYGAQIKFSTLSTSFEKVEESKVEVYPNPSNGIFYVKAIEGNMMDVFSLQGQLIQSKKCSGENENLVTFDLSGYAKGIYLIRIKDEEQVYTRKILLE